MSVIDNRKYAGIMNLPHHVSPTRPQMPISDRAAQFSPFAALTGYADVIRETARLTLTDGTVIPMEDVLMLDGAIFGQNE